MRILRGEVRTLEDAGGSSAGGRAEAIAFVDGRIVAVGSLAQVRGTARALRRGVVEESFQGTLVPGLTDAHGHLASLGRKLVELDVSGVPDFAALVERVRVHAAQLPRGTWLRGRGWDQTRWPGAQFPHHAALSSAVPHHPVLLRRVDGHAALVNASALRLSGIDGRTRAPSGGRILRDGAGAPTGVLIDNAMDLVRPPPYTRVELRSHLRAAVRACLAVGLTSVHDMGTEPEVLRVLRQMARAGELPMRVVAYLWAGDRAQLDVALRERVDAAPPTDFALAVRGVKLIADGAMGSRGAAFHAPYDDEPSQRGLLLWSPEALERAVLDIARAGFQPAVHAIGDRAISHVLRAFRALPAGPAPPRVEHLQVLPAGGRAELRTLARKGVVASMQPTHLASDQRWVVARVGAARAERAYAWRTALESGAILAFGSDFPVESPDPRPGVHAAVTRGDLQGRRATFGAATAGPGQTLDRLSALRAFTSGPARAAALSQLGRLVAGAGADFTVLGADPLTVAEERLPTLPVLRVYVRGVSVYPASP